MCVSRAYLVHVVVCFVDAKPSTLLLQTGLVVRPESKGDVSEAEVMSRSEALLSVGVENAEVRGERARCLLHFCAGVPWLICDEMVCGVPEPLGEPAKPGLLKAAALQISRRVYLWPPSGGGGGEVIDCP